LDLCPREWETLVFAQEVSSWEKGVSKSGYLFEMAARVVGEGSKRDY